MLLLENEALRSHPRLHLYHKISMPTPKIFNKNQKSDSNIVFKNDILKKYKRYYIRRSMASQINYNYNGKFEENILIVGRIGYEKTTFPQNLEKHTMFRDIKEVV